MTDKWCDIKDFAAERGSTINAVKMYIARIDSKEKIPEKDLKKSYGFMAVRVGSALYEKIDTKYPLPKTIEIVHDEDLRVKYEKLLEKTLQLTEENANLRVKVAELRGIQTMLEQSAKDKEIALSDRDRAIQERNAAAEQAQEAVRARQAAEKGLQEEKDRADRAEEKARKMENAGLWQRITKKW